LQQIQQTVFGNVFLIVEIDDQPCVEVTIIPELVVEVFVDVVVILEYTGIGDEGDEGTVYFAGFCFLVLFGEVTFLELGGFFPAFAEGGHLEITA
jgi:hypothetical protein